MSSLPTGHDIRLRHLALEPGTKYPVTAHTVIDLEAAGLIENDGSSATFPRWRLTAAGIDWCYKENVPKINEQAWPDPKAEKIVPSPKGNGLPSPSKP